jgi:hypothetical protein
MHAVLLRGVFSFLTNLYCPKVYHEPNHSIRIVEYHRKIIIIIIIPKPNIFNETRIQGIFRVCDPSSCNLLAETNNFVLCVVFLLCLVSELQKPPSLEIELGTLLRSSDLPLFFSWSQGIGMPSLVRIDLSVLELQANTHTISILYTYKTRRTSRWNKREIGNANTYRSHLVISNLIKSLPTL